MVVLHPNFSAFPHQNKRMVHGEEVPLFGHQAVRHQERLGLMCDQAADEDAFGSGDRPSDSIWQVLSYRQQHASIKNKWRIWAVKVSLSSCLATRYRFIMDFKQYRNVSCREDTYYGFTGES